MTFFNKVFDLLNLKMTFCEFGDNNYHDIRGASCPRSEISMSSLCVLNYFVSRNGQKPSGVVLSFMVSIFHISKHISKLDENNHVFHSCKKKTQKLMKT